MYAILYKYVKTFIHYDDCINDSEFSIRRKMKPNSCLHSRDDYIWNLYKRIQAAFTFTLFFISCFFLFLTLTNGGKKKKTLRRANFYRIKISTEISKEKNQKILTIHF